ncbi:MAG: hypothetical protein K8S16_11380 [Bacteroidales bacterium]|nr:hypothetical protein [Bacteroidales bacterium]
MKKISGILIIISFVLNGFSQTREVPYTLDDRDRHIRTEEKVESLRNEMNSFRNEMNARFEGVNKSIIERFDNQQRQIDNIKTDIGGIKTMLLWGFGILFSLFLFILGYMIWDRRTAISPVREKTFAVSEKINILEKILIEESKTNKRLAEILHSYGIL